MFDTLCYKTFLDMGKLMNRLQKQLENNNTKSDALDCIKVYDWIKDTDGEGRVMESRWNPMVTVKHEGKYPNYLRTYKLTIMGQTLLKGMERDS